jgi:hypothetical protein
MGSEPQKVPLTLHDQFSLTWASDTQTLTIESRKTPKAEKSRYVTCQQAILKVELPDSRFAYPKPPQTFAKAELEVGMRFVPNLPPDIELWVNDEYQYGLWVRDEKGTTVQGGVILAGRLCRGSAVKITRFIDAWPDDVEISVAQIDGPRKGGRTAAIKIADLSSYFVRC